MQSFQSTIDYFTLMNDCTTFPDYSPGVSFRQGLLQLMLQRATGYRKVWIREASQSMQNMRGRTGQVTCSQHKIIHILSTQAASVEIYDEIVINLGLYSS